MWDPQKKKEEKGERKDSRTSRGKVGRYRGHHPIKPQGRKEEKKKAAGDVAAVARYCSKLS